MDMLMPTTLPNFRRYGSHGHETDPERRQMSVRMKSKRSWPPTLEIKLRRYENRSTMSTLPNSGCCHRPMRNRDFVKIAYIYYMS
jgi:hypothetical protein